MGIPRPEYPRPQFVRGEWLNLNGEWDFEMDPGCSGRARGMAEQEKLKEKILVPFCPESKLSGIGNRDFMPCVWYTRTFELPESAREKRVFVNFGAADYRTEVWVNGISAGIHEGGYSSFSMEITRSIQEGTNRITVCCEDDTRSGMQPSGKQSDRYESYGCLYTRTTGIWQTVWLEWMNHSFVEQVFYTPDAANGCVHVRARISQGAGCELRISTSFEGENTGSAVCGVNSNWVETTIPLTKKYYWSVGDGKLYDVSLKLEKGGECVDEISGYFGLRSVGLEGMKFMLNGKPVFQRLVLDQGFYPDGVYTAPSDEALKHDIEMSMAMGFNGARLHEKVFEQRFLYWADRMGYLCWGEMANWGLDNANIASLNAFLKEWLEIMDRDYSAPCIIGWCPFNEVWGNPDRDLVKMIYRVSKSVDSTRPVIDVSGGIHVETDIYDVHDYTSDPEEYARRYGPDVPLIHEPFPGKEEYAGEPVFVSEYGGIGWSVGENSWSYGKGPETEEEFLTRYKGLTDVLLDNPRHIGFCYTQLTDVEQEQNGLYTFDRKAKFDPAVIHEINARKAAIETE